MLQNIAKYMKRKKGKDTGEKKISAETQAKVIDAYRRNNKTQAQIARENDISPRTVANYISKVRLTHGARIEMLAGKALDVIEGTLDGTIGDGEKVTLGEKLVASKQLFAISGLNTTNHMVEGKMDVAFDDSARLAKLRELRGEPVLNPVDAVDSISLPVAEIIKDEKPK